MFCFLSFLSGYFYDLFLIFLNIQFYCVVFHVGFCFTYSEIGWTFHMRWYRTLLLIFSATISLNLTLLLICLHCPGTLISHVTDLLVLSFLYSHFYRLILCHYGLCFGEFIWLYPPVHNNSLLFYVVYY